MKSNEVHISSMVVHANPDEIESVKRSIEQLRGVEIYGESETGKLVVVLESDDQSCITDVIDQISNTRHVLNTALVYHQFEPIDSQGNDIQ